jgi:hypothetical protein
MSESVSSVARRVLNGQGLPNDDRLLAKYVLGVERGEDDAANSSRDFGRGYAFAKRLGQEAADPHPPIGCAG